VQLFKRTHKKRILTFVLGFFRSRQESTPLSSILRFCLLWVTWTRLTVP
jgi:hypothetical protein